MNNHHSIISKARFFVLCLLIVAATTSCREDDPAPPNSTNRAINGWILDEMQFWYLWNTEIPANPDKDLDPPAFFASLLYHEDRFSWIEDDYEELINSLQGINMEAGYEFVLYRESETNNNVIAQVLYIKPGSPAASTDLKRGDIITHVNNQQLTLANYQSIIGQLSENHTIRYRPLDLSGDDPIFREEKTLSLTVVEFAENPNFLSEVYTVGDRKIGYYVYNFFATGTTAAPEVYAQEMDAVFADFKAQGITDLILDLRFNNGGSESAARDLASYIAIGVDENTVFARREYNDLVEAAILNDPQLGEDFLVTEYAVKANNIGNLLTGGRVYVLTSSRTASASELVINSLKPFMDVFLIGDVTYGKNVGSISLQDTQNPSNDWGMQPIVVKVYNSLNQSDYSNGFIPNLENLDNNLIIYPLGDMNETMLNQAITHITGAGTTGRIGPVESAGRREALGNSLDYKPRSGELIIDRRVPDLLRVER